MSDPAGRTESPYPRRRRMDPEELAFARAMLAAPHDAARRLVYADWLEECGAARASLVREAEGWEVIPPDDLNWNVLWFRDSTPRTRFSICAFSWFERGGPIVSINIFDGTSTSAVESRYVGLDGTAARGRGNWAWLLSLAMARGLKIPGLAGNRGNPPDGY